MQQSTQNKKSKIVQYFLNHPNFRTFVFQFITCAFLTFMANGSATIPPFEGHPKQKNIFRQIYVALIIYIIICFSGSICGAFINPAVTLASFLSKKSQKGDFKLALSYVSSQFTGCFTGFVLSKQINGIGGPIYMDFPDALELLKECTEQMVATFLLILFILIITTEETTFIYSEAWAQLIIAFVFFFCLTFSTHFQCLNPAVVFGGQLQGMMYQKVETSTLLACTFLASSQLLGGFLGQLFFKTYKKQVVEWKKPNR